MLTDKLREGATGPVAKVIFSLIIISFAVAGVGSYLMPKVDRDPVKVNGRTISQGELERDFKIYKGNLTRQFGMEAQTKLKDPAFLKDLRQQVLEKMINEQASLDYIEKSGVLVNQDVIKAKLLQMPEFQIDGKFSQKQYESVLSRFGYTPNMFAEYVRQDLAKEVYLGTILYNEFALPYEANAYNDLINEERTFKKVVVNTDTLKEGIVVTDEELQAYYKENSNQFLKPEEVKASYIFLTSDDLASEVKYTDEDLEKFFNLHSELYVTPEKRVIAHILFDGDNAEAEAKQVLEQVKANPQSFAKLAKQYSKDTSSADNGGELEAFASGKQESFIDKATYALAKEGDISEVVQSSFGYHIIKLVKIIPEHAQSFADAKNDVIKKYTEKQAHELFLDKKQIISDISYENPDSLAPTVAEANKRADGSSSNVVKEQRTDFVTADSKKMPEVLQNEKVLKALFSKELRENNTNSEVISLGEDALVVIHIDDYKEPTPKAFDDVKKQVNSKLLDKKIAENSAKFVTDLEATLKKGESIKSYLDAKKIVIEDEVSYTRITPGVDFKLLTNLFEMPVAEAGKASIASFNDEKNVPYIVVLTKVSKKDLPLDKQREAYYNFQLTQNTMEMDKNNFEVAARTLSKVEYNTDKDYLKSIETQDGMGE